MARYTPRLRRTRTPRISDGDEAADRAGEDAELERRVVAREQDAGDVGGHAEERGVAEREHARVAEQHVVGEREEPEDQDLGEQARGRTACSRRRAARWPAPARPGRGPSLLGHPLLAEESARAHEQHEGHREVDDDVGEHVVDHAGEGERLAR